MAKKLSVKEAFTKSELVSYVADKHEITKKMTSEILDSIKEVVTAHVAKKGPGQFTWAGFFKVERTSVKARKARNGVNPFTGEAMVIKAKPASQKIKIKPLKDLKNVTSKK